MRASNDGTAKPVTVVVTIRSTSFGLRPASSSALDRAAHPSSTAFSMKMSFASPKSVREEYLSSGRTKWRLSTLAFACSFRRRSSWGS